MNKTLFSLVMLLSLNLFAMSGTLTFDGSFSDAYSEAFATSTPDTFLVKTSTGEMRGNLVGSGAFGQVDQNMDKSLSEVAGETYQGYSNIIIAQKDPSKNEVYLSENSDITKDSINIVLSYKVEALIVSGTWQDYLDGNEITVKVTDAGNQVAATAIGESMTTATKNAMQAQMPDATFDVKTVVSDVSNTGLCKISKVKAVCTRPNLKLHFAIKARF